MKKSIRIASGQGFWGDLPTAPIRQVKEGNIDYLMMDYLAEVTMSIMQKQKLRNPDFGYARDFVGVIEAILPEIAAGKVRVLSNAGGVNPVACKDAILQTAAKLGIKGLKVAVVDNDNILSSIDELIDSGHELNNMESGEPISHVKDRLLSANIYYGAEPMVEALAEGAHIVVTGRVTDTGLCLAPMVHEFGWDFDDADKMASGTVAGHILECGAQSSGGNFTDWELVPNMEDIGFPIVEAYQDGTFVVTKHKNTGGLVSEATVKEQLLYEIGDPSEYITPDCVADFTSIRLKDDGPDRVLVSGIKGKPKTPFYKVSASYLDGYKISGTLVYAWPDALKKAVRAGEILEVRAKMLGLNYNEFRAEYIGYSGCSEIPAKEPFNRDSPDEVQLRVALTGKSRDDLNRFGMELAPLILTGPGAVTGFAGGRPKAGEIVAYWPALIRKDAVSPKTTIYST
ncbi:MAG: DUF1446 domain-containing protein [Balneolales bacterium]|nr:DUF1446 domain-containing protein [Balneolales bacterium]